MRPKAVVFDITGTLRCGDNSPIDGAAEAIARIRRQGLVLRCLSNNPREMPDRVVASLNDAGFSFRPEEVLTANGIAVDYILQECSDVRVLVLTSIPAFIEDLERLGVNVDQGNSADVVLSVLGRTPPGDADVARAVSAIKNGAKFVATSADLFIPWRDGAFMPVSMSFARVVARLAGKKPTIIGKPSAWARQRLLATFEPGLCGPDLVMVGDHLRSDISFGQRMGARTALELTGLTLPIERRVVEQSKNPPTTILRSVAELPDWLLSLN